jgi:hypothetical protein
MREGELGREKQERKMESKEENDSLLKMGNGKLGSNQGRLNALLPHELSRLDDASAGSVSSSPSSGNADNRANLLVLQDFLSLSKDLGRFEKDVRRGD